MDEGSPEDVPQADLSGIDLPEPERLAYGDGPAQFADLHRPQGAARGVVVVVHGGFWLEQYDLALGTPLAQALAAEGWAALNLEYRRIGGGPGGGGGVPATLDDVSAGIDLLADSGLPLDHVLTLGHSAGGHLAVWAAGRQGLPRWRDARVRVTGAVSQAGVLDLAEASRQRLGEGAVDAFVGASPEGDAAAYDLADPARMLPLDVPVHCVHGTFDSIVPLDQSQRYVAAARAAGATADLTEVPGGHFVVIGTGSPVWRTQLEVLDALGS